MFLYKILIPMNSLSRLALTVSLLLMVGHPVITLPAQAQTAQGYELLNKGWVNDAIAAFQTALKKNPQDRSATLGLARSFQKAGKLDEAWSTYQKALVQDKSNQEALLAVGMLGEYKGIWQAAGIDALTQLLKLDASNRPALAQRALLLGYQGEFDRSLSDYSSLLTDKPSLAILIGAAKINGTIGPLRATLLQLDQRQTFIHQHANDDGQAQIAQGRKLTKAHFKASVAYKSDDGHIAFCQLETSSQWHGTAHGAQPR